MLLKNALTIAENFGEIAMKIKEEMKIREILLYGSVSYNKEEPRDIDIMLVHYNPILDSFFAPSKIRGISNLEKIEHLQQLLEGKINIKKKLENTLSGKAIMNNQLNIIYLNELYFSNETYRNWWEKTDEVFHKNSKPKYRLPNESFLEIVFRQGYLFNELTKKYDIKSKPLIDLKN